MIPKNGAEYLKDIVIPTGRYDNPCLAEKKLPRNSRMLLEDVVPLKSPYTLNIDVCGACNFRCVFCPCNTTDFISEKRHKTMPLSNFMEISDKISEFPVKPKVLSFGVFGEPFLNRDFVEIIRYANQNATAEQLRLTTNGSMLNSELNSRLLEAGKGRLRLIFISVEALNSAGYEETCSYKLNFEQFIDNISDLYYKAEAAGCKISVKIMNTTLKSKDDEERFYSLFQGISHYHFIDEPQPRWAECDSLNLISNNAVKGNRDFAGESSANTICSHPLTNMVIHANGDVSPCCVDWKHEVVYGNINEESAVELWNGKRLYELRRLHLLGKRSQIKYCKSCLEKSLDDINQVAGLILENLKK